jgi:TLD
MSLHGVSMITFMKRINREEITLVLCQDEMGHKFGGMAFEEWVPKKKFFGTGESFVFTFHTGDICYHYSGTGNN